MSTLTRWHSYANLPIFSGDIRDVRKWNFCVKAFESYHITACECIHLVRRGHFRSRDKDGGHTIGSAIPEKPMLHANFMALSFIERELWASEVYIAGIRIFFTFFALVTLTWSDDLHIQTWPVYIAWRYTGFANTNFLHQRFPLTDRQNRPKLSSTPLRE